ncbi:MAG TPA: universal stress protein [Acidimicrobiales bacterium]|nr:universal stress protein [Acidimicrobiales bacterium]
MERIVVGIDGSDGSRAALRWAIAEAVLRGAKVEAVSAFHVPYAAGTPMVPLMLDPEQFAEPARALLAKEIAEVADQAAALAEPVAPMAVEGPASVVLIEAGRDASMIVVGARGHGGLSGMLLGSVSRQVTEHASVPVVVVPKERS